MASWYNWSAHLVKKLCSLIEKRIRVMLKVIAGHNKLDIDIVKTIENGTAQ